MLDEKFSINLLYRVPLHVFVCCVAVCVCVSHRIGHISTWQPLSGETSTVMLKSESLTILIIVLSTYFVQTYIHSSSLKCIYLYHADLVRPVWPPVHPHRHFCFSLTEDKLEFRFFLNLMDNPQIYSISFDCEYWRNEEHTTGALWFLADSSTHSSSLS